MRLATVGLQEQLIKQNIPVARGRREVRFLLFLLYNLMFFLGHCQWKVVWNVSLRMRQQHVDTEHFPLDNRSAVSSDKVFGIKICVETETMTRQRNKQKRVVIPSFCNNNL